MPLHIQVDSGGKEANAIFFWNGTNFEKEIKFKSKMRRILWEDLIRNITVFSVVILMAASDWISRRV